MNKNTLRNAYYGVGTGLLVHGSAEAFNDAPGTLTGPLNSAAEFIGTIPSPSPLVEIIGGGALIIATLYNSVTTPNNRQ